MRKEEVFRMDYQELNALLIKELGLDPKWSCHLCWESSNDSMQEINVPHPCPEKDEIQACLDDGKYFGYPARDCFGAPDNMMHILHERGIVEAGTYIIDVMW